jgi:hypothetical protein
MRHQTPFGVGESPDGGSTEAPASLMRRPLAIFILQVDLDRVRWLLERHLVPVPEHNRSACLAPS